MNDEKTGRKAYFCRVCGKKLSPNIGRPNQFRANKHIVREEIPASALYPESPCFPKLSLCPGSETELVDFDTGYKTLPSVRNNRILAPNDFPQPPPFDRYQGRVTVESVNFVLEKAVDLVEAVRYRRPCDQIVAVKYIFAHCRQFLKTKYPTIDPELLLNEASERLFGKD